MIVRIIERKSNLVVWDERAVDVLVSQDGKIKVRMEGRTDYLCFDYFDYFFAVVITRNRKKTRTDEEIALVEHVEWAKDYWMEIPEKLNEEYERILRETE